MVGDHMKFTIPCQSFLDTSFFQELARLKLEVLKLDSSRKELTSRIDIKHIPKGSSCAHLFLSNESFGDEPQSGTGLPVKGSLYNYNTIEDFKKVDKASLLNQRAQEAWKESQDDPNNCVRFFVISFADLKSYKFFHWVCVPCFQLESLNLKVTASGTLTDFDKYDSWFDTYPECWSCLEDSDGGLRNFSKDEVTDCATLIVRDTSTIKMVPSALVKNFVSLFKLFVPKLDSIRLILVRSDASSSFWMEVKLCTDREISASALKVSGWERNSQNKLTPRATDLSTLLDPLQVADQSLDLNLKLMKWRIAPELDLDVIKNTSVLLLGAGTLGCYVGRALLAWGVREITFVDNGRVSYSNPVRQPLFVFDSCGKPKAATAAESLRKIFPLVKTRGVDLQVPMIGHPVMNETKEQRDFETLHELVRSHDVIFLLMDSRETRWLPTVLGCAENKIVINAALGFDSYVVMRHGAYSEQEENRHGCYFCQDVVAPSDSLADRTLDQMCTVTRPGVALMAASQSVELLVSLLQHQDRNTNEVSTKTILGDLPHQVRGFLSEFKTLQLRSPAFKQCSACSSSVVEAFRAHGWDFVAAALNNYKYVEDLSGLTNVQAKAEDALKDIFEDWDEELDEDLLV
ncbi:LAME_0B07800g1_1 [Lachancea meyersii CBS 8951]|uniref:Ubiquitin-like modifier-activating enzyme ATG7 n=1 Tax=Lachancea meyersii CBS 8951 TaxID=1266667 RepID=A0A1G4IWU4_9SACH|nr:LAME_0B07800g1_1 [Lachancea meyersii CBS 8951]